MTNTELCTYASGSSFAIGSVHHQNGELMILAVNYKRKSSCKAECNLSLVGEFTKYVTVSTFLQTFLRDPIIPQAFSNPLFCNKCLKNMLRG